MTITNRQTRRQKRIDVNKYKSQVLYEINSFVVEAL